jgi:ribosomal-protein-alanine N-acetyltransferase
MKYLLFQPDDLEELMEFIAIHLDESYNPQVFLKIQTQWPDGFAIARRGGKMVGAACGALLPGDKLRVLILVLAPGVQGQGHGRKLLEMLIAAGRKHGCRRVTLEARVNSKVVDFYRHLGFSNVDLLPCYYQDGADAVVMERPI